MVDFIREHLRLTGTHVGCDTSQCGACVIHKDGQSIKSCTILAAQCEGADVTTIEGIATSEGLHPVQEAIVEKGGVQCGFCTAGIIVSSVALLNENPKPTPDQIRRGLAGNLCRCTGYTKVIEAVTDAAKKIKKPARRKVSKRK